MLNLNFCCVGVLLTFRLTVWVNQSSIIWVICLSSEWVAVFFLGDEVLRYLAIKVIW